MFLRHDCALSEKMCVALRATAYPLVCEPLVAVEKIDYAATAEAVLDKRTPHDGVLPVGVDAYVVGYPRAPVEYELQYAARAGRAGYAVAMRWMTWYGMVSSIHLPSYISPYVMSGPSAKAKVATAMPSSVTR